MAERYYLGLATTIHDPAVAIVGPSGEVLFAEATERHLQYKRAFNCEPDSISRMGEVLGRFVPADAELIIATSWGERFSSLLQRSASAGRFDLEHIVTLSGEVSRSLVAPSTERAGLAALHLRQRHAGLGTVIALQRLYGTSRIAGLRRYRHHLTHAAFAAFSSPFDEAACLVVDGMGEGRTAALFRWRDAHLEEVRADLGRVSPGLFFGLVTDLCGFDQLAGEEWKVMGLAPYGSHDPKVAALLRRLYRPTPGGSPRPASAGEVRDVLAAIEAHRPVDAHDGGWADLARAGQDAFCELMDWLVAEAYGRVPAPNLVLGGGCALNSSFIGTIAGRHGFDRVHVPSAPADDGNALGAALLAWSEDHPGLLPAEPRPFTPYLGSTMSTGVLEAMQGREPRLRRVGDAVVDETVRLLREGMVVGWVQGRAEFGPRALGNRSILADPRLPEAKDMINAKVKYREAFRPFAPSILAEHAPTWFENAQDSPYMERTLRWKPLARDQVPAVVHVDGTGRLQTVTKEANGRFHDLLAAFGKQTGVPVLLNTSFNVMGKPIVHSVEDAILTFFTTDLDALVIEDWLLIR